MKPLETTPESFSLEDFQKIEERYAVRPESYTKPFRVYCDVDGVVNALLYDESQMREEDSLVPVKYYRLRMNHDTGEQEFRRIDASIRVSEWAREGLSKLSKHPLVDFTWMTTWRANAPMNLDAALGIESVGYVPWQKSYGDFPQVHKIPGIEDDQRESPSKFIWLEDEITTYRKYDDDGTFLGHFTRPERIENDDGRAFPLRYRYHQIIPPSRYTYIIPNPYEGLAKQDFIDIDKWIDDNRDSL